VDRFVDRRWWGRKNIIREALVGWAKKNAKNWQKDMLLGEEEMF
jgi:hypothetical protein